MPGRTERCGCENSTVIGCVHCQIVQGLPPRFGRQTALGATVWKPSSSFCAVGAGAEAGGAALGAGDSGREGVLPVASASFLAASRARQPPPPPPPNAPGRYLPAAGALSDGRAAGARVGVGGAGLPLLQTSSLAGVRAADGAAPTKRRWRARSAASSSRCCWRRACSIAA